MFQLIKCTPNPPNASVLSQGKAMFKVTLAPLRRGVTSPLAWAPLTAAKSLAVARGLPGNLPPQRGSVSWGQGGLFVCGGAGPSSPHQPQATIPHSFQGSWPGAPLVCLLRPRRGQKAGLRNEQKMGLGLHSRVWKLHGPPGVCGRGTLWDRIPLLECLQQGFSLGARAQLPSGAPGMCQGVPTHVLYSPVLHLHPSSLFQIPGSFLSSRKAGFWFVYLFVLGSHIQ